MAATFVATAGPPEWKVGRWSQVSPTTWQEQKIDNPKQVYQFQVVNGPKVPGSSTVRLKMQNQNTEVLLLSDTIQIFSNAGYLGEFVGRWERGGGPVSTGGGVSAAPGYAASRQPQAVQETSMELTRKPSGGQKGVPPAKSVPPAMGSQGRQGPGAPAMAVAAPSQTFEASPASQMPFAKPGKPDGLDKSPAQMQKLIDASKKGDVAGVNALLAAGVDPDGPAKDGTTPLMAAASGGHLRVVETLLAAFADPNSGKGAETPMTIAFQKGNQDVLKALFGASFNNLDNMIGSTSSLRGGTPAFNYRGRRGGAGVPDDAMQDLRDVTSRIAREGRYVNESQPLAPMNFTPTAATGDDMIREETVRLTMRNLAAASKIDSSGV